MRPVKVKILRRDPEIDAASWLQEFDIPYEEGMNVLYILDKIYEERDHTLAYQSSCKCTICGSCKVKVNGKAVLVCDRIVKEGEEITIEPAGGHPLVRDLVVDLSERVTDSQ